VYKCEVRVIVGWTGIKNLGIAGNVLRIMRVIYALQTNGRDGIIFQNSRLRQKSGL